MDFSLKCSWLCEGWWKTEEEAERQKHERKRISEYGRQRKKDTEIWRERNGREGAEKRPTRPETGTQLDPHWGGGGTNQWLFLSIHHSISHLIASQYRLQEQVYNYFTIDQTGCARKHKYTHTHRDGESLLFFQSSDFIIPFFDVRLSY